MGFPHRTAAQLVVFLWTLQGVSICARLQGTPPGGAEKEFVFESLNRVFGSFVDDLAPIELGSMRIGLSSPEHSMTLERHSARLRSLGNAEYETRLSFDLHGWGILALKVEMGGVESDIEDELTLPSQSLVLEGRLKLEPVEGGYEITLLEAFQQDVAVKIESKIAGRIVPLCRQLALVLISLECDVLEETLSVVRVPMPAPGKIFFLSAQELTELEIEELDAFLEAGSTPPIGSPDDL
jgi:hypothetical protein